MNRANAIKLRHQEPAILWRVPGGEGKDMLGTLDYGDLVMPADLLCQEIDGVEYIPLVVWVRRSDVMRCGE